MKTNGENQTFLDAVQYQIRLDRRRWNVNQNASGWNPCPNHSTVYFALENLKLLNRLGCSHLTEYLQFSAIEVVSIFNGTLCNQSLIENYCINQVQYYLKIDKRTRFNNVTWENLVQNINLASVDLQQPLTPCLFIAFFDKYFKSDQVFHTELCKEGKIGFWKPLNSNDN